MTRKGFTLIELLVVIALIFLLAGLAAAFLPVIGESDRAARGGTMLQQWILTAKQKALRDQVPSGIRLLPYVDPTTGKINNMQVVNCQFIEQPDDFTVAPSSAVGSLSGNAGQKYVFITMHLTDQVAAGDHLEILGSGLMHTITSLGQFPAHGNGAPPNSMEINLDSSLTYSFTGTMNYRILRAPRVTGDDLLQLPDGVMIDLQTNANYSALFGGSLPTANPIDGSYDILFAPSGAVLSPGATSDTINLWVREQPAPSPPPPAASTSDGNQTIIAIYVRSGLTAAHPPSPGPQGADPYAFIKDGRTSGK